MKQVVKKLFNVESLTPGMVLANNIYEYNSNVLLYRQGAILTQHKIDKLKKFGIISIQVEIEEDIIIETPTEEIVKNKICLDFDEIYEYANYIVLSVLNNKDVKSMMKRIDNDTYGHSTKVAILSTMVGMHLENFEQDKLEELALASLLHDIGKSTIDFSVLNKPGRLTKEEYEIMKTHAQNGFDILTATEKFDPIVCESVLSHHENEDGTGYPNCQKGGEIPLYARIIHLCDVYSALTNRRCYKEAWTNDKAFEILEKDSSKFEVSLLDILKTSLPIYLKDDLVYLSTNELATVIGDTRYGTIARVYGSQKLISIEGENTSNSVYVKKKIRLANK